MWVQYIGKGNGMGHPATYKRPIKEMHDKIGKLKEQLS